MHLKIYSLLDGPAQAFTTPMFMHNDGEAIRAISNEVNKSDKQSNLALHPVDFTLFCIGEYDDKTSEIKPIHPPRKVILALELVADSQPKYSNVDLETVQTAIEDVVEKVNKISTLVDKMAFWGPEIFNKTYKEKSE